MRGGRKVRDVESEGRGQTGNIDYIEGKSGCAGSLTRPIPSFQSSSLVSFRQGQGTQLTGRASRRTAVIAHTGRQTDTHSLTFIE